MDYRQVTVHPESRIAPNATLVGHVEVAKDATILFNATLRGDYGSRIVVGEGSNVQENSCLHLDFNQDCIVGRGVTIGHGAVVHGCTLGRQRARGYGGRRHERGRHRRELARGRRRSGDRGHAGAGGVARGGRAGEGAPASSPWRRSRATARRPEGYAAIGRDLAEQGILYWGADIPADARTIALAQD